MRVSAQALDLIALKVATFAVSMIQTHPSVGKTLKP